MSRIRNLLVIFALALPLPAAVVGCGGGDDGGGDTGEDPADILQQTFAPDSQISSGVLDITASLSAGDQGSFNFELQGPFQGDPDNPTALPQLDWTASVNGEGAGQTVDFEGEAVVTEDNAYVAYGGDTYEVGTDNFNQFKQFAEQAAEQAGAQQTEGQSFKESCELAVEQAGGDPSACDFDVVSWFTNLSNDGTEDVEGASTVHISGDADIARIVEDLSALAEQTGGATSAELGAAQLDQIEQAVTNAHLDVYSGEDDHLLRKLEANLSIDPSAIAGATPVPVDSIDVDLAVTLSGVNEDQTISAPSGPTKPIDDLLSGLGVLGGLGGLGGVSGGSGLGGSSDSTDKYLDCVSKATTPADFQKCEALL